MPEDSAMFHEPLELLSKGTMDMHRAVVSVVEELQAIDWYGQRVEAAGDPELRAILQHNADEEKEHAAMLLEWIRRHDPKFEAALRTYLFRSGSIVAAEAEAEARGGVNGTTSRDVRATVGSLKAGTPS
jgi:ferritin-like protein